MKDTNAHGQNKNDIIFAFFFGGGHHFPIHSCFKRSPEKLVKPSPIFVVAGTAAVAATGATVAAGTEVEAVVVVVAARVGKLSPTDSVGF